MRSDIAILGSLVGALALAPGSAQARPSGPNRLQELNLLNQVPGSAFEAVHTGQILHAG
jgi:hypothetical protein